MNDNKRIAVNTIVLYFKLIIVTIVSLIASRLILQALGTNDYGLYSVVGGIVSMLNILGTTMVSTSYRYISVEIGKREQGHSNNVFNTLFMIHVALAALFIIFGETLGIFYIKQYLNVDPAKIPEAIFVLHASIVSTAISVLAIPFNGVVIAREKFTYTAVIEVVDVFFKLVMVLWLTQVDGNRLRLFAIIMMAYSIFISIGYTLYCVVQEKSLIKWHFNRSWSDYKDIFAFSTWILIGAVAVIGKIQGAAIVLNWFFGTLLNAAMGLANQVNSAVNSFVRSLTQATNPQIMKNVEHNQERSISLVYTISKFSFFIMLIPLLPLILYIDKILVIWLKTPPQYTSIFIVLFLLSGLISCFGAGFDASIQATGNIRKNQIGYSIINLSLLPIIVILYKMGFPPYTNGIVMILLSIVTVVFQCCIMKEITIFTVNEYIKRTILPSIYTIFLSTLPLLFLRFVFGSSILAFLAFVLISIIWSSISIFIVGLSSNEKNMIINLSIIRKLSRRYS